MPELYLAVAEIETRRNNFDEALKNIDEVLDLTNDAPKISEENRNFEKSRKTRGSESGTSKTSGRNEEKITLDRFAEARACGKQRKGKSA